MPALAFVLSIAVVLTHAALIATTARPDETPMHIQFERSGGFAGTRLNTSVDINAMPADEAAELRKLVQSAAFFDLPQTLQKQSPGADRFQYKVTIETSDRRHTVELDESAAPPALRPLLNWLTEKAKQR